MQCVTFITDIQMFFFPIFYFFNCTFIDTLMQNISEAKAKFEFKNMVCTIKHRTVKLHYNVNVTPNMSEMLCQCSLSMSTPSLCDSCSEISAPAVHAMHVCNALRRDGTEMHL